MSTKISEILAIKHRSARVALDEVVHALAQVEDAELLNLRVYRDGKRWVGEIEVRAS